MRLRQRAAALRESEERYRALFEAIDSGFCIVEVKFDEEQRPIDYRFVEVNPAFAAQTGLTEAAGKWMRELAPDHEQHWFDIYGRVALTGEAVRFENVAAALRRWYDVYAFRIGEPGAHRVAILFNDISDRRRAETALRESEARYRALFDVSPQMVWFADAEGRCTYVNQHYTDFVGLPAERVLGEGWLAAVHPEDRAGARAAWAGAVASEGDYEVEYRIQRGSDGSHRWLLVRGAPLRGPDGRVERWIGVGIDIDDRTARRGGTARADRGPGRGGLHDGRRRAADLLQRGRRRPLGLAPPAARRPLVRLLAAPLAGRHADAARGVPDGRGAPGEPAHPRRGGGGRAARRHPRPLRRLPDAAARRRARLVGGVNVLVDITKRKAAEVALAASEARLRLALEAGQLAFWELDLATGAVLRAPFHDAIFGYAAPLPEWSYGAFLGHVLPEDRAEVERAYRAAVGGRLRRDDRVPHPARR